MEPITFSFRSLFGLFLKKHVSKNDPIQKSYYDKKSVFSCSSTTRQNFWNPFTLRPYFHHCLFELLDGSTSWYFIFQRNYLTSEVHFDMIYLKITEWAGFLTTVVPLFFRHVTMLTLTKCWRMLCTLFSFNFNLLVVQTPK